MKKQNFNLPLVNAHTHAAMIAFRGLAEDLPLDIWLKDYIWPMEAKLVSAPFVYKETVKAIKEMKTNGIRAFCDMYFFENEVAKAAIKEKINVVIGETILDFPTPSCKTPHDALKVTESLYKKYQNNPFVKVSVAPHSIYTVSKNVLIDAKKLARKHNLIYQIHLAETKKEFDDSIKQHGKTPVEYMDDLKLIDSNTLLHHVVWVTDKDINILAKRKANVVHCPLSNLKLGSGISPVSKMLNAGINVSLGSDGAASSNRLDIWEAGKIAALLQKGINLDPTNLPTKEVVKMMTLGGLKALKLNKIHHLKINQILKNYHFLYEAHAHDLAFN